MLLMCVSLFSYLFLSLYIWFDFFVSLVRCFCMNLFIYLAVSFVHSFYISIYVFLKLSSCGSLFLSLFH